jgi:hypothetical protein
MRIDNSISSTYGLTSLFGQSGQRNKQPPLDTGSSLRWSRAPRRHRYRTR